ncbi:hypothetical protein BpHYR1_047227 [Brachionus plicatilis]|uniref:Uncharacterized protein n=1 Tax=Brachionus plicatilis TaxID=10195 RepID=A0A3M7T5S4_BRAPC|nr:hypothetical protein BpHYR1_047227 [Brachionus plicatilis]
MIHAEELLLKLFRLESNKKNVSKIPYVSLYLTRSLLAISMLFTLAKGRLKNYQNTTELLFITTQPNFFLCTEFIIMVEKSSQNQNIASSTEIGKSLNKLPLLLMTNKKINNKIK